MWAIEIFVEETREVQQVKQQKLCCVAALIALSLSGAFVKAQSPGNPAPFDVASIKPAQPGQSTPPSVPLDYGDFFGVTNPHGRFVQQAPLAAYIGFAYKVWPSQEIREAMLTHLPKWAETDPYVINAQAQGNPTKDQMRRMMQSLLADRFKLAVHFERQEFSVFALVLDNPGKPGPKLNLHTDGVPCDVSKMTGDDFVPVCDLVQAVDRPNNAILLSGRNLTINQIAAALSQLARYFTHPVVDQTGLDGHFDFTLQWTRESNDLIAPDPQGSTMRDALVEQLGLKLKSTKAFLDTIVVDHVERPSEN
jgi:bla regulator protein BlaR1